LNHTQNAERVLSRYSTLVYRVCYVKLASTDHTLVDDAFQNTFLYWIEHPPKTEPNSEHEKAWFIRCAIHRCTDLIRSRRAYDEIPESLPAVSDDTSDVMQAILALPEKYKIPLYLTAVIGYSVAEAAKILGITSAGMSMRLTRARRALAAELGLTEYEPKTVKERKL